MEAGNPGGGRSRRANFDEIVAQYDRIRPAYPGALFGDILAYTGAGPGAKALEIGAGTGKATTAFLDAGCEVSAVEIGGRMAAFLRRKFEGARGFRVIPVAFEDALLEDNHYDLIYAATAFHWVDADIGCPKAFRCLKQGGTFALFRYHAVPAEGDDLYEAIQAVYERHFTKPYVRPARKTAKEFWQPDEMKKAFGFEDLERYGFVDVSKQLYRAKRAYGASEYVELLQTYSNHRSLPEADREALYAGVYEAVEKHGGQLRVDYTFQLYMGRKV